MIYPAMEDLLDKMDSRYTLVIAAAKRARQLTAGSESRTDFLSNKNVSLAIHEIYDGKVTYERVKEGIK